jgi:hypothetical protein
MTRKIRAAFNNRDHTKLSEFFGQIVQEQIGRDRRLAAASPDPPRLRS